MKTVRDCRAPTGGHLAVASPLEGQDDEAVPDAEDTHEAIETRALQVNAALHGQRLDKVLVTLAPEFSRNHLQSLIESGHVCIDTRAQTVAARRVRAGQRVEVQLMPTAESQAFRPEALPLSVSYEDEYLLVIDKPAGLVVHPAAGNWSGTLLNGLLARHRGAAGLPRAGIVHRLDKDTSGLMVVGKTLPTVTALVRAIGAREVERHYLAIVHGAWPTAVRTVDAPIGRDPRSRIRMAMVASGKPARTDFELLSRSARFSGLRCRLHSGRTHQIRVHAALEGHPLVADSTYGGANALGLERQALHATRLAFAHPIDGRAMLFESPPPVDLRAAWAQVFDIATMRSSPSRQQP